MPPPPKVSKFRLTALLEMWSRQFPLVDSAIVYNIAGHVVSGKVDFDTAEVNLLVFSEEAEASLFPNGRPSPPPPANDSRSVMPPIVRQSSSSGTFAAPASNVGGETRNYNGGGEDVAPARRPPPPASRPVGDRAAVQPVRSQSFRVDDTPPTSPVVPGGNDRAKAPVATASNQQLQAAMDNAFRDIDVMTAAPASSRPAATANRLIPTSSSGTNDPTPAALAASTLETIKANELVFYFTSMTSSRQVRDHCRSMERHLFLLRLPYQHIDVAETAAFVLPKLRRACGRPDVELPLLFIGERYVGNFDEVDDMVENGRLIPTLRGMGLDLSQLPTEDETF